MRLALLTGYLSNAAGGVGTATSALGRALHLRGDIDVRIFGLKDRRAPDAWKEWGPTPVSALTQVGYRAFGWAPALTPALQDYDPDLIHAQGLWTFSSAASLAWHRSTKRPHLISIHGMLDPWARQRSLEKKSIVRLLFEDAHLNSASCLHATNDTECMHIRSFGLKNPVAIVPYVFEGVPLLNRTIACDESGRILFLSRLHPKKGIDELLRAWRELEEKWPNWSLIVAGPDEVGELDNMKALASQLGLTRVVWAGAVYGLDKHQLYKNSDIFVLPTHAENFGIVIAEALAHEVPVITTTNAPWSGLRQHRCGWWIDLNKEALTVALEEAMSLPKFERRAMGARGHAWIEHEFAQPVIAQQMFDVYAWILGSGSRPACVTID